MGHRVWTITGLLIVSVVMNSQTNESEDQVDTCVWVGVEVSFDHGHNSSDEWCEAPGQPVNGGYRSETGVDGNRYNTGDTITYYCNRGHRLIGQANRTCNGTPNGWQPHEPYCQPEYIGLLMTRLNGIEAEMRVIKQNIATFENKTLQIACNISSVDNRMSTIDNNVTFEIENNASAIYNMELFSLQIDRERLEACTDITKPIDQDTLTKCKTMQMGVRNGHSVSVYTWVIQDYNSKESMRVGPYYSQPFYHTVPGYKFRLRGYIYQDSDIRIRLQLLPGEYDDQLKWPFSPKYNVTVLTNTGLEAPHRTSSGEQSTCHLDRPTSPTDFRCYAIDANWDDVTKNKKHILTDDSVVVKLYFYN